MLVDVEILRAFAEETASTSDAVSSNNFRGVASGALVSMEGSAAAWAARSVDEFVGGLTDRLAAGFDALATSAHGSADSYEVTDSEFAAAVGQVFLQ